MLNITNHYVIQIKTTMRYHLTPFKWLLSNKQTTPPPPPKKKTRKVTRVEEDVEKLKLLCTVSGNVKWHSCCGKTVWQFLK